ELIIESAAESAADLGAEGAEGVRSINGEGLAGLDAAHANLPIEQSRGEGGREIELDEMEAGLEFVIRGVCQAQPHFHGAANRTHVLVEKIVGRSKAGMIIETVGRNRVAR